MEECIAVTQITTDSNGILYTRTIGDANSVIIIIKLDQNSVKSGTAAHVYIKIKLIL